VLFIALSRVSFGELNNAISTAQRLVEEGASVLFLMPTNQQWYVRALGLQVITLPPKLHQRESVQEIVASFKPDGIILADSYLLDMESELIDLEALLATGVPCATLDALALAPEARTLENSLIREQDEKIFRGKYNRLIHIRALPEPIQVFRPCPVHAPNHRTQRITPLKIYNEPFTIDPRRRREVRRQLGIQDDAERLIMIAKASWSMLSIRYRMIKAAGHSDRVSYNYEAFLQDLMIHYLAHLDVPVTVVSITSQVKEMEVVHTRGNIRFVSMPSLDIEPFAELQRSSDLFVTDNMPSSAMAKAVFAHVPAIALMNTKLTGTQDGSPIEFPDTVHMSAQQAELVQKWNALLPGGIYPFHLYPNGWIRELEPLFKDNAYGDALVKVEMYDIAEATRQFTNVLCDERTRAEVHTRQQSYIDQVLALPSAHDVVASWVTQRTQSQAVA
jgi:hypothetical protein